MTDELAIRTMSLQDMGVAVEWAAREGWNPGLADAHCFHRTDPEGFLIGELDGLPVSCISVVRYGGGFGFLGFYIVKPEFRGRGFGWKTWLAGFDHLADRNIGLDGVIDQQDNYRKSGFALAHRNIRYQGLTGTVMTGNTEGLVIQNDAHWNSDLLDYDRQFFPEDRELFIRGWCVEAGHKVAVVLERDRIAGYGVIRPCRDGFKVGPLFADTDRAALSLLHELTDCVEPDKPFFLDVPEPNSEAMELAQSLGMKSIFETARMYSVQDPELPLDRIYGITTFELG